MKRHLLVALLCVSSVLAQQNPTQPRNPQSDPAGPGSPGAFRPDGPPPEFDGPPSFGPEGPGPRRGGPGGMMAQETKLLKQFDKDGNGRLDASERKAAREERSQQRANFGGGRGFGPGGPGGRGGPRGFPGGPGGEMPEPSPGPKLSPADVPAYPDKPLYDPSILRTLFLEFENADWEQELADFNNTDVEVPAQLTVDGKVLKEVGVHFRGMSSFMAVGQGRKRSLNLSLDDVHKDQSLGGYRTLNLLNSHEDPSFLRTILYFHIAREYLPAPKANFVRVVINGECWGVYVNVQQFNKDFVKEWYGTTQGTRWKVPGSPGGQGSLAYLGENPGAYRRLYEIKSKDSPKPWADFAKLCKTLNETPVDSLPTALEPLLDVEGALRFLALENALINNDGYWVRSSDYSIYQDPRGQFHVIPHDANETFAIPGGPGFGGRGPGMRGGPGRPGRFGEGGGRPSESAANPTGPSPGGPGFGPGPRGNLSGPTLDPLVAASDESKPLLSKLLAVPQYRTRYLALVGEIADRWLDWKVLGPIVQQYRAVITEAVAADTRKLSTTQAFEESVEGQPKPADTAEAQPELRRGFGGPRGPGRSISLKAFADQRREFLLQHPAVKAARPGA